MDECKAAVSPRRHKHSTDFKRRSDQDETLRFREAVLCSDALEMTATRPVIAYAVAVVALHGEPQEEHWVAVKRIFRYLQGTKTHGIASSR
ncbi:hypothetical protein Pcac1_g29421 [Phytophthora cactorum]|nr:hypothetical protein Pcac1_g29421 [Phytophthora cactorum]